jgi:uncharacterized damage-inducible protein DinB
MLHKGLTPVQHLIQTVSQDDLTRWRDGGTGWTALETICHLRDFEALFIERATLTVEQELPPLPFPNPDQLAAERQYIQQDPAAVHAAWAQNRQQFLAYLRARPNSDWERVAQHPTRGLLSLQEQLVLAAWHDVNHLEQMTRTLLERQAAP